jgi:hypothetical protein
LRLCIRGKAGDAAGQGRLHAAGRQHGQYIAPARAALQRTQDACALFGADQAVQLLVICHGFLLVG